MAEAGGGKPGARAPLSPTSLKWGQRPPFQSHAYQYGITDYILWDSASEFHE